MTWTPEMVQGSIGVATVLLGLLLMALDRTFFGYRTPGWYITLACVLCLLGATLISFTPT